MKTPKHTMSPVTDPNRSTKHFFEDAYGETCEIALENDPVCRYRYVANVVGLTEQDEVLLRRYGCETENFLAEIVDEVYEKMFQHLPIKKHFAVQHHGYHGHVPNTVNEVALDNDQTVFRKKRLLEYLRKLSTATHDETFVMLMDWIGEMHTSKGGNVNVSIPLVQLTAILGFVADTFFWRLEDCDTIDTKDKRKLQSAYSKLFWIQNNMFLRHYK